MLSLPFFYRTTRWKSMLYVWRWTFCNFDTLDPRGWYRLELAMRHELGCMFPVEILGNVTNLPGGRNDVIIRFHVDDKKLVHGRLGLEELEHVILLTPGYPLYFGVNPKP